MNFWGAKIGFQQPDTLSLYLSQTYIKELQVTVNQIHWRYIWGSGGGCSGGSGSGGRRSDGGGSFLKPFILRHTGLVFLHVW